MTSRRSSTSSRATLVECVAENAMDEPGEIAHFYDRVSPLMRELLDYLATHPGIPRPFPDIEDAMGWPRRRISSVLGGVGRIRKLEFGGRRPYHFQDERQSASGRWGIWMGTHPAHGVESVQAPDAHPPPPRGQVRGRPRELRVGADGFDGRGQERVPARDRLAR